MKKILLLISIILYGGLFIYSRVNRSEEKDDLYTSIVNYAENNDTLAISKSLSDLDYLIPGKEGLKVDVNETYKIMKEVGYFDVNKIVYENTKPEIKEIKNGAIYHGNEEENNVYLNINVAWGEEYLEDMLGILDKYQIKANFFVEGNWANKNPNLMKKIAENGHLIGNHSYSHKDFSKISAEEMKKEIEDTNKIIEQYTNKETRFFAPPSGAFNDEALKIAKEYNMETILWNVDTIDWQKPSKEVIINRVLSRVDGGSFILMHPTNNTLLALETIIIEVAKKGLDFNTLDSLVL